MASQRVLALDLGPTSIGWALLEESAILATGVRVFPEGVDRDKQGGEIPKNQQRRIARGMRRQVRRRARRRRLLRESLVLVGLLPPVAARPADDLERREWEDAQFQLANPYQLRIRALDERLEPFELGRQLLHLGQRRGFLSNRKADQKKKQEDSKLLAEISELGEKINAAGHRTLGEHFARQHVADPCLRVRGKHTRRQMYLDEFDAIWECQRKHHPDVLTEQLKYGEVGRQEYPRAPVATGGGARRLLARFGLHGLLFYQRPLYWPKSVIGRCELNPKEKRCPRADRAAQEFRILLEVNNLAVITGGGELQPLAGDRRTAVMELLGQKKEVKFADLRKKLGLHESDGFNLEAGDRRKLDGHVTDAALSGRELFGKGWKARPDAERTAIVRSLIDDDEATFLRRAAGEWNIDPALAEKLLDTHLPEGYSSYGRCTIERLLPHLRQGLPLLSRDGSPCAVRAAGFLTPWERPAKTGGALPEPPAITNPIVRQALFEVRKLVNAVVRKYGKPDSVHVELAREVKGTGQQRQRFTQELRARERRRAAAAARIGETGDSPTRGKINRYLLWEEQNQVCMYSGRPISLRQLLGGEVDVDHVLPYSRSLDDSLMNRVVCFRSENNAKGQRTVYQWLAETEPAKYDQVLQRAARLPIEIRNRKLPKFSQTTCELEQFISRQLTDTAYITAAVLNYLRCLGTDVLASKGQLTAELRHQWGLDAVLRDDGLGLKNREDHRHHAVDAIVIALTNRSRLQQLAKRKGIEPLGPPWESFRDDVESAVNAIHVSHRARRKVAGALHEDTVYGVTQKSPGAGPPAERPWAKGWIEQDGMYVLRKPLEALSLNEVDKIRDERVREVVKARLANFGLVAGRSKRAGGTDDSGSTGKAIPKEVWKEPLYLTARDGVNGAGAVIRKVRLVKADKSIVPLGGRSGRYVKPGKLHHVTLFELTDSKGKVRRDAVFVSMLEAARRVRAAEPVIRRSHPGHPTARFLMSLSPGEMLLGTFKGTERLVRFSTGASTSGQMWFVEHTDARQSSAVVEYSVMPNTLTGHKVIVDTLGQVYPAGD